MAKLTGKVAVITGGSSGMGLASAKRLVEEGAYVFITGRRQSELDKAAAEIGHSVTAVQGDVASLEDLDRLFTQVQAEKGGIDIVVTSAGVVEAQTIDIATPEHFDKTFNVNARGVFFTVQKALPLMTRGGAIVLISSCLNVKGRPAHSTYNASKAAVRSFARTWAAELIERGIRVNSLSPGAIDTPLIDGATGSKEQADHTRELFAQMTPLGRIGRADEMASAVYFLASDESSFCIGIDLAADGGITQL